MKWLVNTSFHYILENDDSEKIKSDATAFIEEMLLKYVPKENLENISVHHNYRIACKTSSAQKERKDKKHFSPQEVFNWLGSGNLVWETEGQEVNVNMNSSRYRCFERDSCVCQACGLIGTAMILDMDTHKNLQEVKGHFNLYGIEKDQYVLFTKDHIVPKSQGGGNSLDNLQTYCYYCNQLKGDNHFTNEEVKSLRDNFNINAKMLITKECEEVDYEAVHSHLPYAGNLNNKNRKIFLKNECGKKMIHGNLSTTVSLFLKWNEHNKFYESYTLDRISENKLKTGFVIPENTLVTAVGLKSMSVLCSFDNDDEKIICHIPPYLLKKV